MDAAICPAPLLLDQGVCKDEKEKKLQDRRPTALPIYARDNARDSNALMRQSIVSWNALSPFPPSCRTVSFSSWCRFSTASTNSKSSDDMRASVLLEEHGTTPEFDLPLLERCGMRVCESTSRDHPEAERTSRHSSSGLYVANTRRRFPPAQPKYALRTSSASSWKTATSASSSPLDTLPSINFQKRTIRPASTTSLLTEVLKGSPPKQQCMVPTKVVIENIAKELGLEKMNIEDLPEDAFETDSEDED